ncbi:MAG: hypothetical protein NZV14_07900 [Bryobacteraceae bacterium]|nr:hypothetical protein [Bryobacteraceae bacterium]MDW8378069.1 BACON domain-containing carbohydrate-binding protein [Bryobacterales bacterium]
MRLSKSLVRVGAVWVWMASPLLLEATVYCSAEALESYPFRVEGVAEIPGTIGMSCFGSPVPVVGNVVLTLTNSTFTSKIIGAGNKTEAAMTISAEGGTLVEGTNLFFGVRTSPNTITFYNIPLLPGGPTYSQSFEISNLRVDGGPLNNLPAIIQISITSSTPVVVAPSNVNLGTGQSGFAARTVFPATYERCVNVNRNPTTLTDDPVEIQFTEASANFFRSQAGENGVVFSGISGQPGVASHGTMLAARFSNVPAGAILWAAVNPVGGGPTLLAQLASESGTGPTVSRYGGLYRQIPVVGGNAVAVWEVTASNPFQLETVRFRVVVEFPANRVSAGTSQVQLSFHPDLTTSRIPRFRTAEPSQTAFVIQPTCSWISCTPTTLSFSSVGFLTPPAKFLTVNVRAPSTFKTDATAPWLTATPSTGAITTSTVLSISANPPLAGLGLSTANLVVSAGQAECLVEASLEVIGAAVAATPDLVTFDFYADGTVQPAEAAVVVHGSLSSIPVEVVAGPDSQWIGVSPASLTVPGTFRIRPNVAGLPLRNIEGMVFVRSPGGPAVTVQVNLRFQRRQLTFQPNPLNLTWQAGSTTVPTGTVQMTSSPPLVPIQNVGATTDDGRNWLLVSGPPQIPGMLNVTIDPARVNPTPGQYGGTIQVQLAGNETFSTRVLLTVTPAPTLSVNPGALEFRHTLGAANPQAQGINVTSSSPLNFTVSSNQPWLTVTPTSGVTPSFLSVAINPAGLAVGVYTTSLVITSQGTAPVVVPVTLHVLSPAPSLSATPNPLAFFHVFGSSNLPPPQILTVTSSAPLVYTATASSNGNWLSISPTGGNTVSLQGGTPTSSLAVSVNPAGLAPSPAPYTGSVTLTTPGSPPVVVDVLLTVSGPLVTASPSALTFTHQISTSTPPAQTLLLSSPLSGQVVTLRAISSGWLMVTPATAQTPSVITVSVMPTGLEAGIYTGLIQITAGNQTLTVPVTLNVVGPFLSVTPGSLRFEVTPGAALPPAQTISVSGASSGQVFSVSATSTGGWLSVAPLGGSLPSTLTVSVAPQNLQPGSYTGQITISSGGFSESVTVVLVVQPVTLTVSPATLSFEAYRGGLAPGPQTVNVTSLPAGLSFSVTTSGQSSWLSASALQDRTPASIRVAADATNLEAGTYTAVITVTAQGQSQTVPVTLNVVNPAFNVSPASLSFRHAWGQDPPPAQSISVGSVPPGVSFAASIVSNSPWLNAGAQSGRTPGSIAVSVNPTGLEPGEYTATIAITAAGQVYSVGVSLTVLGGTLSVSEPQANLTAFVGAETSLPVRIQVTSTPANLPFSFSGGTAWLSAESSSGRTPATLTLRARPQGLAPGQYSTTITITAPGAINSPQTLTVTLLVVGAPSITSLSHSSVTAGSGAFTLVVSGTNFTPASQVLANGAPLPTTFVSSNQLRTEIPPNLIGRPGHVEIRVTNPEGLTSSQVLLAVRLPSQGIRLEILGNPGPGEQPRVVAVLSEPVAIPLSGTFSLAFTGRDSAVQFASGSRSASFAIAAGATRSQEVPFSTGTVAGRLEISAAVSAQGSDLTPDPAPTVSLTIDASAPVIRRVELQRSGDGFVFVITGFTTTREIAEVNIRFSGNVQPVEVNTNVAAVFANYFNNPASEPFGGQFELRFPFTGQSTGIISAVVSLTNSRGRSNSVTVNF